MADLFYGVDVAPDRTETLCELERLPDGRLYLRWVQLREAEEDTNG